MSKPTGKALLLTCLLVLPAGPAFAAVPSAERRLSGMVLDEAGLGIEGVSVFLNPVRASMRSPLTAPVRFSPGGPAEDAPVPVVLRTGADGTFTASLPPGRYLVAAFKPGYDLVLTEVGVFARGFLEVRLRAAVARARDGREPREWDLDWILRRDAEDVLRSAAAPLPGAPEPGTPEPGAPEPGPPPRPPASGAADAGLAWLGRFTGPIDGRFTHLVGTPDPFAGDAASEPRSRNTSLGLAGNLGDLGRWRFDGSSGRSALGFQGSGAARQAEQVAAAVDWRLTPHDAVSASIAYGTVRYAAAREAGGPGDQVQRTALLRSRWDRSLGESAALYVDGLYLASGLDAGDRLASPGDAEEAGDRTDTALRTSAGIRLRAGDHLLDFGLRAGLYRHGLRGRGILVEAPFDAPLPIESGGSGGVVSLQGGDDWRLSGPYFLNYGLGYHSNPSRSQGYLVPRIGVTREAEGAGGLRFRSLLLARLDDPFASASLPAALQDGAPETIAARRIGGMLSVERGPIGGAGLSASVSYLPFAAALAADPDPGGTPGGGSAWPGDGGGIFGEGLLFLTDGLAVRQAFDVEVRRSFGLLHGSLSGSVGRVGGRLAPALDDSPAHAVAEGEARYVLTRLRARYAPTDTEVRVGWRRVTGEARGGGTDADGSLDYSRLDVVVAQELPRLSPASARLRLLMAYQDLAWAAAGGSTGAAPATAARLSGGVELEF